MIGSSPITSRKKGSAVAKLSLISLMDIFTILVFFLLLNSGETQDIDSAKYVSLPDSSAGQSLHEGLTIFVGQDNIYYDEKAIVDVESVLKAPGERIEALSQVLIEHSENLGEKIQDIQKDAEAGFSVTIMADKKVSYELLKMVMETCRDANYRSISLAVNQVINDAFVVEGSSPANPSVQSAPSSPSNSVKGG